MMSPDSESTEHRSTLRAAVRAVLLHRRLPIIMALLAVALASPGLLVGWQFDDDWHRLTIRGSQRCPVFSGSAWDIFDFLNGDPKRTMEMADYGLLPWFVEPSVKGSFWRPLTVATHWLDYRLWPNWPSLMHAHSLAWFGLMAAAATLLYRRMMGPTLVAGLAALMFAIDDAHTMPAAWIANRNALPAAVFGIFAIIAHDRWRRDGRTSGAIAGPLFTVASLLSGEGGVATLAYIVAHAVCLDRAKWTRKTAALVPYAVILVIWRVIWSVRGHGVANLGLYIDPVGEPLRFALGVIQRAPLLLIGQWTGLPAELGILLNTAEMLALQLAGYALLIGLVYLLKPLLRADPVLRFWALGMTLSLLPICATFPADRLLIFVGLGAMALVAQLLADTFRLTDTPLRELSRARPLRVVGWWLVAIHLILAPVLLSVRAAAPVGPPELLDECTVRTPLDASIEHQDLIIVTAPSIMAAHYLPMIRELNGQPVPRHTRILAPALPGVTVRRIDERTLTLRPHQTFICWRFDHLFRSERDPMRVGERVELTGLSIEVTKVAPDGRAAEASFRFAVPLEDPSLRWLWWKDGEFIPFTPPAVGRTIELPEGSIDWW